MGMILAVFPQDVVQMTFIEEIRAHTSVASALSLPVSNMIILMREKSFNGSLNVKKADEKTSAHPLCKKGQGVSGCPPAGDPLC